MSDFAALAYAFDDNRDTVSMRPIRIGKQ